LTRRSSEQDEGVPWSLWDDEYYEGKRKGVRNYYAEPMMDVMVVGNEVKVYVEAPGSREEDVVVEDIKDSEIEVSIKFRGKYLRRRIELPTKVEGSNYVLEVRNGVAIIKLPKK